VRPAPSIRGLIWQCTLLLRSASLLVPKPQRQDWYREWHAEIWHWAHFLHESGRLTPRAKLELARHCWGAFADAAWHRFDRDRFRRGLDKMPRSARFCLGSIFFAFILALLITGFAPTIRSGLTGLPYYQPDRMAVLSFPNHYALYPDGGLFRSANGWSRVTRTATGVAAYSFRSASVELDGNTFDARSVRVSPNFFETLGTRAERGRLFRSGDEQDCSNCIVLTEKAWKTTFHADPSIVGKKLTYAGITSQVIGVLPADFAFLWPEPAIWALPPSQDDIGDCGDKIGAVLRLRPGISASQAEQEFRVLAYASRQSLDYEVPDVEMMVSRPRQAAKVYLIVTMLSLLGGLVLAGTRLAATRTRKLHLSVPCVLRWWAFLALKTLLLLSTCFVVSLELPIRISRMMTGAAHPLAGPISTWLFLVTAMVALSWCIHDQCRRCRICLRRLGNEASVGAPGYLLLDWWGTELVCSDGHGLLHVPERKSSWEEPEQWVPLDESWKPLFEEPGTISARRS
jgi:MacB-like periplasmic core domain